MASADSVLPWTGKAKRVSEAEKNKRNHFQCCKATISVHLNKSHFMRISSKLQQLNVDTRDEIYHRKLFFRFFNRTRYLILKRRASLLAVIDKNEWWKCRVVELGTEQTIGLFILLNVGAIIENPSQWFCLKLTFGASNYWSPYKYMKDYFQSL